MVTLKSIPKGSEIVRILKIRYGLSFRIENTEHGFTLLNKVSNLRHSCGIILIK